MSCLSYLQLILGQAVKMSCQTYSTDNSLGLIILYFLTFSLCFCFPWCSGTSGLASDTHTTWVPQASARLQVAFCHAHMSPIFSQSHLDAPLTVMALQREQAPDWMTCIFGHFAERPPSVLDTLPSPPPSALQTSIASCTLRGWGG